MPSCQPCHPCHSSQLSDFSQLDLNSIAAPGFLSNLDRTPSDTQPAVPITRTVVVRDAEGLKAALENAESGTEIKLLDGVYDGKFELNNKNGVTITGSENMVLKNGGLYGGYGLHLINSNNNTLRGFTVSESQKGIVLDNSNGNVLDNLKVDRIGQEGIHFRNNSSNNTLQNSYINNIGLTNPEIGEGVYVGSARSNNPNDQSNGNVIIFNTFGDNISAQNIDVKVNTRNGRIENNSFNSGGMHRSSVDNVLTVQGYTSGWVVQHNSVTGPSRADIVGTNGVQH